MSNEKNNVPVSDEEMAAVFKENDAILVGLVKQIKDIYSNTLMVEKQVKIDALRRSLIEEDIKCQLNKIQMFNEVLNELK